MSTIEALVDNAIAESYQNALRDLPTLPPRKNFSRFVSNCIATQLKGTSTPTEISLEVVNRGLNRIGTNDISVVGKLALKDKEFWISGTVYWSRAVDNFRGGVSVMPVDIAEMLLKKDWESYENQILRRFARAARKSLRLAKRGLRLLRLPWKKRELFEEQFYEEWENRHEPRPPKLKPDATDVSRAIDTAVGKTIARAIHRTTHVQMSAEALQKGESTAVTLVHAKIAAILYDRIWDAVTLWEPHAPLEVFFKTEESAYCLQFTFVEGQKNRNLTPMAVADAFRRDADHHECHLAQIASKLSRSLKRNVIPLYLSGRTFDAVHKVGERETLAAAISELELIDEESLEWEQVLEIRRDKKSRNAIQRFLRWADSKFLGQREDQIRVTLEERYEKYKVELEKHGCKTVEGFFETLIDARTIWSSLGAAAGIKAAGTEDVFIAGVVGLSLAIGQATVKFKKRRIESRWEMMKLAEEYPDMAILTSLKSR